MTTQHTSGPWTARLPAGNGITYVHDPEGFAVANVYGGPSEIEANARLIAAAPVTTEALDDLLEAVDHYAKLILANADRAATIRILVNDLMTSESFGTARAALAAVRGEEGG